MRELKGAQPVIITGRLWIVAEDDLDLGNRTSPARSQKFYTKAANCERKKGEANNGDDDAG